MSLVPDDKEGRISFYKSRLEQWAARAAEIGTTLEQVAALANVTAEARDAFTAQRVAQQAALTATQRLHDALDGMMTQGAKIILQVRSKAASDGESIYGLALLPVPAKPSPIGKPGMPYRFETSLWPNGSVALRWKCDHPAGAVGTIYEIFRRVGSDGQMVYLARAGKKNYLDQTVPRGAGTITYQIRAVRSTKVGDAAEFTVNFGTNGRLLPALVSPRAAA